MSRRHGLKLVASRAGSQSAQTRGRVTHDPRGNAVWDWGMAPSELQSTSQTGLLRQLSTDGLSLEQDPTQDPVASDPYNRSFK